MKKILSIIIANILLLGCMQAFATTEEMQAWKYNGEFHLSDTADILKDKKVYFFGNGAAKCKQYITSENAIFLDEVYPLATSMIALSEEAYTNNNFADVAYFEPFYLKAAHVTVPKNQLIPNS